LFYIAAAVGLFAGIAYSMENQLTAWLLRPAAGQKFIYTTPGGGFDFLFKLCLYGGIAASIPVIVYHIFRYISPLLKHESRRFMLGCTLWSSTLAMVGIAFGYFVGLPAAMHFLLQNFSSDQISALITIQSYMSFVLVYLLGSALLFQLPLILILINRIKPLKPGTLMRQQRWVFLGAFVIGAIISPTPDIRNQAILSGPIIFMYEASIIIIWALNRRKTAIAQGGRAAKARCRTTD
jgi:sec-independent protein translocase protein TatC